MQQYEQIITSRSAACRAVAFDVFGTLLLRDVARPADLFYIMEYERMAHMGFAESRIQAEAAARAQKAGEITLDDIYAQPQLAGAEPQAECMAELAAVTANPPLLRAAAACHARGQLVYAISDMYLPQQQLEAMLHRCGYDFLDGVFVSSQYGVQKRSGKLFGLFLQQTGLKKGEVMFFGDDFRADVCGAALGGVRGYMLPGRRPLPYMQCTGRRGNARYALVQNRVACLPRAQALGLEIAGPLVVAFARWLHAQKQALPTARLAFLARDMYMVRRAYQLLYPGEDAGVYLQVSRKSLIPALISENTGDTALLADALPRQSLTARQALEYCGLAGITLGGYNADTVLDFRTRPLAESAQCFLVQLVRQAAQQCAVQGRLAQQYLAQQLGKGEYIIVDIGSGGTTQRIIEALLHREMQGRYLACDARLNQCLPQSLAQAFLFGGRPAPPHYWAGQPMLEKMISETCGETLGYGYNDADGRVTPVQRAMPQDAAEYEVVREIQAGALQFVQAWDNSILAKSEISPAAAIQPFLRLVSAPQLCDAALLGAMTVEDGGSYALAQSKSAGYYLMHPGALKRDLMAARWKVGFLKQLLRLPLPYGKIYERIKKQSSK